MPVPMIHSLAQKSGKSDAEVEAKWNQAKEQVAKEYPNIGKDDDRHWALVASITKKMVGIKETVMANKTLKDLHPSAFHIDGDKKEAFYDHPDAFVKDATAAGATVTDHGNGVHSANIDGTEIGKYHKAPIANMANGYGKLSIPAGAAPSASGNDDIMYMSSGDSAVASGPDADALGMMGEAEAPASTGSDPKPEGVAANPAGLAPKDEESEQVADRAEDKGGLAPHVHTSMESVDFLTLVTEELAAVGDTAVVMQPFSHADYFEMIGDLTAADPAEVASSWNEAAEQIKQSHPDVSPDSDEFQALVAMEVLGTFDDLNDEEDDGATDVDNPDADAETPVAETYFPSTFSKQGTARRRLSGPAYDAHKKVVATYDSVYNPEQYEVAKNLHRNFMRTYYPTSYGYDDAMDKARKEAQNRVGVHDVHDDTVYDFKMPYSNHIGGLSEAPPRKRADENVDGIMTEASPGSHLSAEERSKIAKKARKGKDVGHGHFKDVEEKAAKEYGSKKAGQRVAAAAMWKHAHENIDYITAAMIVESMSRKDYVPIAAALKNAQPNNPNHKQLVNDIADIMQKDNPNFDRKIFYRAAGLNEGVYTKGAVGAVAGGAIGAAAGSVAGPGGAVAGGIVGAGYGAAIGVISDAIAALHKHEAAEKDPNKQAKIRAEIAKKQAHLEELKAKQTAHKQTNEGVSKKTVVGTGIGAAVGAGAGALLGGPVGAAVGAGMGGLVGGSTGSQMHANDEQEKRDEEAYKAHQAIVASAQKKAKKANEAVEAPAVASSTPNPDDKAEDASAEAPKLDVSGNLPQYKNGVLVLAPRVQEGILSGPSDEETDAAQGDVEDEEDKNDAAMKGSNIGEGAGEAPSVVKSNPVPGDVADDTSAEAPKDKESAPAPEYKNGVLVKAPAVTEADKWSDTVTKDVTSHPKADLYATGSAKEIAASEKAREGSAGAAIKAIAFYKNRAGDKLSADRKAACDGAIAILQKQNEAYLPEAASAKQKAKTAKIHDAIKRLTALRIQRVNAIKSHTPHADLTAAINVQKARIKALRA